MKQRITKILIANRGEIACRVAATARRMGIATVAVYSDADAQSKHVAACDEAFRLGPAAARESYLRGEAIIQIAQHCGAQAIHPGYGFLSENEQFAQAVTDAGLIFIGPPASAIQAMGLKAESKRLMAQAGVPLVPGYHGADQDPSLLKREADAIGYPVLIKASAGGGGKGMRIVNEASEFETLLASCQREARNSFGDDAVLIERYVTRPRHIEIQVFGDSHGQCVYLFERDCSVQRRHQKVIEEAPAPGMTDERRRAMGEAAVAAARAVGYVGAGTVEFIAEPSGKFYFMEMNTRLQVEHPVTEMIVGQDLVEWQIRVASGEPLPLTQAQLSFSGHAIEARIYAENPEKGFLPSTGLLALMRTPDAREFELGARAYGEDEPVRIDSGVREGDTITPHYDPMIAKLIVWGRDRQQALDRMHHALGTFALAGPSTNVAFLRRLMRCDAFATADLDTGLIERERVALFPEPSLPGLIQLAQACAAVMALEGRTQREHARLNLSLRSMAHDPWSATDGWHSLVPLARDLKFAVGERQFEVQLQYERSGIRATEGDQTLLMSALKFSQDRVEGRVGDQSFNVRYLQLQDTLHLFGGAQTFSLRIVPAVTRGDDRGGSGERLTAPMPGKVIALLVAPGGRVSKGQPLVVMEAMKMEHTITAPADGEVTAHPFAVGDQVAEGVALIGFTPAA